MVPHVHALACNINGKVHCYFSGVNKSPSYARICSETLKWKSTWNPNDPKTCNQKSLFQSEPTNETAKGFFCLAGTQARKDPHENDRMQRKKWPTDLFWPKRIEMGFVLPRDSMSLWTAFVNGHPSGDLEALNNTGTNEHRVKWDGFKWNEMRQWKQTTRNKIRPHDKRTSHLRYTRVVKGEDNWCEFEELGTKTSRRVVSLKGCSWSMVFRCAIGCRRKVWRTHRVLEGLWLNILQCVFTCEHDAPFTDYLRHCLWTNFLPHPFALHVIFTCALPQKSGHLTQISLLAFFFHPIFFHFCFVGIWIFHPIFVLIKFWSNFSPPKDNPDVESTPDLHIFCLLVLHPAVGEASATQCFQAF